MTMHRSSTKPHGAHIESSIAGDLPQVDKTAYIHPSAVIIGNVRIGPEVYVGPCAIIRADEPGPAGIVEPITIGAEANVQDGVILHALGGTSVTIGPGTSLAHGAVVHGPCSIGRNGFIGFNTVIFNTVLGASVVVMHCAMVEGANMPDGVYVPSMTAVCCQDDVDRLGPVPPEVFAFAERVRLTNIGLAKAGIGVCRDAVATSKDHTFLSCTHNVEPEILTE